MAKYQDAPDILGSVLNYKPPVTPPEPKQIPVDNIRVDGGTQMRAELDDDTVFEYTQAMVEANSWGTFPAVVAYYDGSVYWLGDGFHRVQAYRDAFPASADGIPCEVRSGTRRDAILHAAGANALHGLRRTNADKQRAVETLLRDNEWAQWSDAEIARRCAVDHKTVGNLRRKLTATMEIPKSDTRMGADGRTYNTVSIGKSKPGAAPATVRSDPPKSPEQRQYESAVPAVGIYTATHDRPAVAPAPTSENPKSVPTPTQPGTMPADLAGRGWSLRTVPGSGKFYCNNPSGPRATAVFEKAQDAITAAYGMQRDLAWEQQDPQGQVETVERLWNTRTATGVLQNMVDYWRTCEDFRLSFKRNPKNQNELAISLFIQTPNGWREWTGATLDDVVRKADLSL